MAGAMNEPMDERMAPPDGPASQYDVVADSDGSAFFIAYSVRNISSTERLPDLSASMRSKKSPPPPPLGGCQCGGGMPVSIDSPHCEVIVMSL